MGSIPSINNKALDPIQEFIEVTKNGIIIECTNHGEIHDESIKILKSGNFFPKIISINLANNGINSLSPYINKCTKLKQLLLNGNKFSELNLTMKSLKLINLSQNLFQNFPRVPENVININLNWNKLKKFESSFFNLSKLSLNLNDIEEISPNISLPNLTFLDIGRNKLTKLPDLAKCTPKLRILEASYNFLIDFPHFPKTISEISMKHNQIIRIPEELKNYEELKILELSENLIEILPTLPLSITMLSLHSNKLIQIKKCKIPKLKRCFFFNNFLEAIPILEENKIEEVSFAHNKITSLGNIELYSHIKFLDISFNQIEKIPDQLITLTKLKTILIHENKISKISDNLCYSNIEVFNISGNPLSSLIFDLPHSIQRLLISYCDISELPYNITDCNKLTELVAFGNNLQTIPLIPNLKKLYLSKNKLLDFPIVPFSIQIIDVSMNQIKSIPKNLILNDLIDLDLSYNHIQKIPKSFASKSLKSLKISHNINFSKCITKAQFPKLIILDLDSTNVIYPIDDVPMVHELMTNQNDIFISPNVKLISSTNGSGFSEMCGIRDRMEDAIVVRENIKDGISAFAIFDGHGGAKASTFGAFRFVKLATQYGTFSTDFLVKCIEKINENLPKFNINDGSTVAIALKKENKIITAHLGDARIVIIKEDGSISFRTIDHKPNNRDEFTRIRDCGSYVISGRTQGILGVSRSIGDFKVKGISSEPSINEIIIDENDKWLLLGCDGVFDVATEEVIKGIAIKSNNPKEFAYDMRNTAYYLLSGDNISVIVVDLKYIPSEGEEKSLPFDIKIECENENFIFPFEHESN